ncbi:MAG: hypothetical protein AAGD06_07415 [Acidobacteriota bacterium]
MSSNKPLEDHFSEPGKPERLRAVASAAVLVDHCEPQYDDGRQLLSDYLESAFADALGTLRSMVERSGLRSAHLCAACLGCYWRYRLSPADDFAAQVRDAGGGLGHIPTLAMLAAAVRLARTLDAADKVQDLAEELDVALDAWDNHQLSAEDARHLQQARARLVEVRVCA